MLFPLDRRLQRLQPLVIFDGLLVKTSRGPAAGVLQTAAGCRHHLGYLASWRVLTQHANRVNRTAFQQAVQAAVATKIAGQADLLRIVADYLIPAVAQRDCGGDFHEEPTFGHAPPAAAAVSPLLVDAAEEELPAPQFPPQSLLWLDRLWKLTRKETAANELRVEFGGVAYGLTGEYWMVRSWETNWQQRVQASVARVAAAQSSCGLPCASPLFVQAQQSLAERGVFECGDVLYLAGNPPRLGHIIPRHHNRSLGRTADREFAITTALTAAAQATDWQGYRRGASGRWQLHTSSVCLGARQTAGAPSSRWIALWAQLRWAAQRIATNQGAFHERELRDPDYEYQ